LLSVVFPGVCGHARAVVVCGSCWWCGFRVRMLRGSGRCGGCERGEGLAAAPAGFRGQPLRRGGRFLPLATLDREWDGLIAHRDHPMISIENNLAERTIGGPVVTRKNAGGSHNGQTAGTLR
jgi:hypothetical protein